MFEIKKVTVSDDKKDEQESAFQKPCHPEADNCNPSASCESANP